MAEPAAQVLKMVEAASTSQLCHTPCSTRPSQQAPTLLQPARARSCCPAFPCPSLGTCPTHKPVPGELGRSFTLRKTCINPVSRRLRRSVLPGVLQGRAGQDRAGSRSRGVPLPVWPPGGCWNTREHSVAVVLMFWCHSS